MFKCQKCNKLSKPKETQNKLLVESRNVSYNNIVKDKESKSRAITSSGWEIVKELTVCKKCLK